MSNQETSTSFAQALQLARQGNFREAGALALSCCQADDHNPDAWLLLGQIQGNLGELDKAIDSFTSAARLAPGAVDAHLGLANALYARGRLQEALAACEQAILLRPDTVDILLLKSTLLGMLGHTSDAIQAIQRALELAPRHAVAHHGLGALLQQANRLEEAVACYRKAIEYRPDYLQAQNDLGVACQMLGRHTQAIASYREVIRRQPGHVLAWYNLGNILRELDDLEEAERCLRKAVHLNTRFIEAYNTLGLVMQAQKRIDEAASQFRSALDIKPDYFDALINLGNLYIYQLANPQQARCCFEHAVAVNGESAKAHYALGNALRECGDNEGAVTCYERALAIDPSWTDAIAKIASIREQEGAHEQALFLLQPLMMQNPGTEAVIAFAASSRHTRREDDAILFLEAALQENSRPAVELMNLHFTLGEMYDRTGRYDQAFEHFAAANRSKDVDFHLPTYIHLFTSLITAYSEEKLPLTAQAATRERQPLFILGMPRSGTSLTEQILACHPDVQAGGEINTFNELAVRLYHEPHKGKTYPESAALLTSETLDNIARHYIQQLPAEGADKPFFTDKMPHNFLHIGLIRQVFPNARIIHCVRDPRDTCLSCYFSDFHGEHPYAYDLAALGQYYRLYRQIMRHWQSVSGLPFHTLEYEQLVNDQESESRRLLEFCGLDWDARCLEFHRSGRFVQTASYNQVRQPMYRSSLARWKRYERHIGPLLHALEPEQ